MALSDWSSNAANNLSVGGVSIAEGMAPGSVNNALRAMMADLAPLASGFSRSVTGFDATNNSGTPNTQLDMYADAVQMRDSAGNMHAVTNTGTLTCNLSTAGPAANGRDQAAAFTASSWVYLYWIYNPSTTTLATLSSLATPPGGPTLPTGYTMWAFATAVRWQANSTLKRVICRGSRVYYNDPLGPLSGGSATTETLLDLSAYAPPVARSIGLHVLASLASTAGGACWEQIVIALNTGSAHAVLPIYAPAALTSGAGALYLDVANNSQACYYYWQNLVNPGNASARSAYVKIDVYSVPNGDS